MMTKTKIALLALALIMVVSLCLSVSAETAASLTVIVEDDIIPGETITATVYLTGTNVKGMSIDPTYNEEALEIQSAAWTNFEAPMKVDWTAADGAVMAFDEARDLADEAILVMTFKVKDDAAMNTACEIGCDISIAFMVDGVETRYNPVDNPDMIVVTPSNPTVGCAHKNTTDVSATEPTCTEIGYTAGVYCNDCEKYISGHTEIPVTDHSYTVLQKNETHHWFKCATCTATSGNTTHTWDEGVVSGNVKTYTCTLEGCGQTKTEEVETVVPGDLDQNGVVDNDDLVYLLMYTFFSDEYPVNQDCDFDKSGEIDNDDLVYLLMYTFFPDEYPIG